MEEIKVNLDNLTNEERETLLKLVEKGNKTNRTDRCIGERYFYINDFGNIQEEVDKNDLLSYQRYTLNNYFTNYDKARNTKEKSRVMRRLKTYALKHNTESINWDNPQQLKWFIKYSIYDDQLCYGWRSYDKIMNQIYFTSEEIARAAVKEVGEDNIKKYLFGVNE